MNYVSEPKVYLVTRPLVDWGQVAAFLEDEGVPPIPDSIRAGEDESAAVVEISARLCYMSYGRGRRDITDFINNLLSQRTAAFSSTSTTGWSSRAYPEASPTSWCVTGLGSPIARGLSGTWTRQTAPS